MNPKIEGWKRITIREKPNEDVLPSSATFARTGVGALGHRARPPVNLRNDGAEPCDALDRVPKGAPTALALQACRKKKTPNQRPPPPPLPLANTFFVIPPRSSCHLQCFASRVSQQETHDTASVSQELKAYAYGRTHDLCRPYKPANGIRQCLALGMV